MRGQGDENLSAKGAYVLKAADGARGVTLIATGSEVGLAVEASATLAKEGIKAAVVSMPSFELFRAQPQRYQDEVLGSAPRIAIEAGVQQSWHEWLRKGDVFIGMHSFGASAPATKLFEDFGITASHAVDATRRAISKTS